VEKNVAISKLEDYNPPTTFPPKGWALDKSFDFMVI